MGKTARPMKKTSSFFTGVVACVLVFSAGLWGEVAAASAGADLRIGTEKNPAASYIYNPVGKPDPFQPFIEKEISKKKKAEKLQTLPISPLQGLSIDQFRLVGIAGDDKRRMAVVEDVREKFYPLFEGTYIGRNNGRVVKILADRVIIEEKVKTSAGKTQVEQITIRLHGEEDEVKP
ncbi:MAG: pilus assembly protein PilP [Syntrophales bacterium]|nr:pilus assembly protein PilP [Syntrophales bacterium]